MLKVRITNKDPTNFETNTKFFHLVFPTENVSQTNDA